MIERTRTRNDHRRALTKLHLIETAERLFAAHGLDGVSLRQIGAAAGSANTSVVRYNFGDKEGLIQAIFDHREAHLEIARAALLATVRSQQREQDPRALVEALYLPLARQCNTDGRHSFAGFIGALQRSGIPTRSSRPHPVHDEIAVLLKASLSHLPEALAVRRMRMSLLLVCETLAFHDVMRITLDEDAINDLMHVAATVVLAPANP